MGTPARSIATLGAFSLSVWLTVAAYQTAHTDLSQPTRVAISESLGIPLSSVSIGSAALASPSQLTITRVKLGQVSAADVSVSYDLWALLGGHPGVRRIDARDLHRGDAHADSAELTLDHKRLHVLMKNLSGPYGLQAGAVATEVSAGHPLRIAASSVRIAGLGPFAVSAVREGGDLNVTAGAEGAQVEMFLESAARSQTHESKHFDGKVKLTSFDLSALAPFAERVALDPSRARASGSLRASGNLSAWRSSFHLELEGLTLASSAIASHAVAELHPSVDGELHIGPQTLELSNLRVELGPLAVALAAKIDDGRYDLRINLPTIDCAEGLRAIPLDLRPHLDGLELTGTFGLSAHATGSLTERDRVQFDLDLANGCHALSDPRLADVSALASPVQFAAHTDKGRPRSIELGPKNPNFRSLDSLPEPLIRAFLAAEDGHFFRHAGFDLDRIRMALANDLQVERFDRGASTISQQVIKNVFLSGERTLQRKFEETVLTWRLEQVVPKKRILELYLNLAEFGPGIYGVEEAAQNYFHKSATTLSLEESMKLAALLPAPRRGMDEAWVKRYRGLEGRLPRSKIILPPQMLAKRH